MVQESSYSVNRRRRAKVKLIEAHGGKCVDCGNSYPPYNMEFDHRDPKEKSFTIAYGGTKSYEKLLEESNKCDLVCSLCHGERTHRQRCNGCQLCVLDWEGEPYGGLGPAEAKYCVCGTKIERRAKSCRDCWQKPTVIEWPTDEELVQLVSETSINAVAGKLNVSFNAVKKRMTKRGLI